MAWRTLSPTDLTSSRTAARSTSSKGEGSEFRYWVWQFDNDVAKDKATRQAAAQIIDRDAIAANAYDGTVAPAYSIVPPGFGGQKDSFTEKYGEPERRRGEADPRRCRASRPRSTSRWATRRPTTARTPSTRQPSSPTSSRSSGLFKVKLEDAEWEEYQTLYKEGAYDLFILGWYPDFLDADNYLTPFIRDGGFFANGYSSEEVNKLLDQELA